MSFGRKKTNTLNIMKGVKAMFKLLKRFLNNRKKSKLSEAEKRYLKQDLNSLYGLCVTYYADTDSVKERGVINENNN